MHKSILSFVMVSLFLTSVVSAGYVTAETVEKIPVIVTFEGRADAGLIRAFGGDVKYEYNLIPAVACSLPPGAIDALNRNPNVAAIELDIEMFAIEAELLPWGVDKIDADAVHTYNKGTGIKVAIIDTGIDYNHPDLYTNYKGGYDFVNGDAYPLDDNGHGTHCAGIVAALDNEIGVIGVAPEAWLYAVKVLGSGGSGSLSNVIAGIQWATNNNVQVISMSLGSDSDVTALHDACDAAYASGVLVVAAAGNDYSKHGKVEADTVDYPGRYSSVIAVAATDSSSLKASFSSTGPEVDIAAPGVNIYSTYKGGTYATMSGTSMACPHVSGTSALVFASAIDPSYDADNDKTWDASEVRAKLLASADDLGAVGVDYWYGYGMVDADEAASGPTVDVTAPDITTLTPADASVVRTATPTISATLSDINGIDYASIVLTVDGSQVLTSFDEATGVVSYTSNGLADGVHYVTLTVKDMVGNMASVSWSFTVDTSVQAQQLMHVENIVMNLGSRTAGSNKFYWAIATVTILDANGNPVQGATVYGHREGATTDSDYGTTSALGVVSLTSDSVKNPVVGSMFAFVVDNIVLNGWVYDASANLETGDTIAI